MAAAVPASLTTEPGPSHTDTSPFRPATVVPTTMLELYQAEECPYSQTVREAMQELGLSFVAHNPRTHDGDQRNAQTLAELEAVGGRDQIPFLVDHATGTTLYESADIVDYLRQEYGD